MLPPKLAFPFILVFGAAQAASISTLAPTNASIPEPGPDGKYTISAEGIRAKFIPYGASISNLFIPDRNGTERDIVAGWDNASYYSIDKLHPHFGGIPGRYANRIANATFEIDGEVFHTNANENGNTLHGGDNGWDYRNFTVTSVTNSSISFSFFDPAGTMGFPGDVLASITYTVTPHTWHLAMSAKSLTAKTPIMLSSHDYWNLDAFQNPATASAHDHVLHMPYSGLRVGVDDDLIPTGDILANPVGTMYDFWSEPKPLGRDLKNSTQFYDTCFLVKSDERNVEESPVLTIHSPWSGIRLDVFSAQEALQIFSCANMREENVTLKETQGLSTRERFIEDGGCVVIEVEDWIDAINQPEWERKQTWGPGDEPYTLSAKYVFSHVD